MNDCSCTNNDVVTDRDSLKNHNIGTNPTIFSDRDLSIIKSDFFYVVVGILMITIENTNAISKHGILTNFNMISTMNGTVNIKENAIPEFQGCSISHL